MRIGTAVELVTERADPQRRKELEQDVAALDGLIDEMLTMSRLKSAGDAATAEDVDLLALAAEEYERYEEAELDRQAVTLRGCCGA